MTELLEYLLANRHRFNNRSIVCCLALARMAPQPDERISRERLQDVFGLGSPSAVSTVLLDLQRRGLIDYRCGHRDRPGYRFRRIGPSQEKARV
jgi:hypothetical protein